jgi:hypothetical protein
MECIEPPPFFPHVQRLFPGLHEANQMITVQPMTVPSALPFYSGLYIPIPSGSIDEEENENRENYSITDLFMGTLSI